MISGVGIAISVGAYHAGQRGDAAVRERVSRVSDELWHRIQGAYDRWGSGLLVLSSIPGLGTVLTAGTGMFGIGFLPFLFWVSLSKVVRNWLLALLLYSGYQRFFA